MKAMRKAWDLVKETFSEWSSDQGPRLGAALSYYTVFSLAPVLLIVISVAGLVYGRQAVEGRIVTQLRDLLGPQGAQLVQSALARASAHKAGVVSTIVGVGTLILGATGVMVELQGALNQVWKVIPRPGQAVRSFVRQRLLSLALVLSFGFVLLVSLAFSAALAALGGWLGSFMPESVVLGHLLNWVVTVAIITLLMALIFKVLPDAKVAWRDVWIGSFVTAVLFQIGKFLIGLYIGKASVASTFGAAGSLAVLLVWVYYSAQIALLGAEFTRAWANRLGSRIVPESNAVPAPSAVPERIAAQRLLEGKGTSPTPRGPTPSRA